MQKNSENTNYSKPKKQSNLDILDSESSNNETLSMSTQGKIISSIAQLIYSCFDIPS